MAGKVIGCDVMSYIAAIARRSIAGIAGTDYNDARQDITLALLERGDDLSVLTRSLRLSLAWQGRTTRTRAIRDARKRGDKPIGTRVSGAILPSVHPGDVLAAAWERLNVADTGSAQLAAWASYADTYKASAVRGHPLPATGYVLPFVNRTDRTTRGARVRAALAEWRRHDRELREDLASAGFVVTSDAQTGLQSTIRALANRLQDYS
jgi:hypothetical protein